LAGNLAIISLLPGYYSENAFLATLGQKDVQGSDRRLSDKSQLLMGLVFFMKRSVFDMIKYLWLILSLPPSALMLMIGACFLLGSIVLVLVACVPQGGRRLVRFLASLKEHCSKEQLVHMMLKKNIHIGDDDGKC
jgi:hypothetical protein